MTLIIEDGSVVENANSYVSIDDCDTYHSNLGNATWTGTDAVKKAAILRAMAWIESQSWEGRKTAYENPLSWPRADVVTRDGYLIPEDEVPIQVVNALCEAALVELESAGALRPALERGGQIKSESIDGAVSVTYKDGAPATTQYHAIQGYLRGLVGSANIIRVEIA